MNDPNSEWDAFERQLRQFRPARPSDELMARLENRPDAHPVRAMGRTAPMVRFFALSLGGTAVLAIILTGVFIARNVHVSVAVGTTPLVYAGSSESVVAARNEGIYTDAAGRPVLVIQLLDLNKSVWKDPVSGNRIEVVRPRQQLLVKDAETY